MNVFVRHNGTGFVESTVIEYASPVLPSEADAVGEKVAVLLESIGEAPRREIEEARRDAAWALDRMREARSEVDQLRVRFADLKAAHAREIAELVNALPAMTRTAVDELVREAHEKAGLPWPPPAKGRRRLRRVK